jgi:hypothetical protein
VRATRILLAVVLAILLPLMGLIEFLEHPDDSRRLVMLIVAGLLSLGVLIETAVEEKRK